jgi:hypothetical protein
VPAAARRGRVALGVAALLLAGCATVPPPPPPRVALSPEEARQALARWAAARAAFTGLRATVDVTVRRPGHEDRTGALLLLSRQSLRLEVPTPFGLPALVTTVSPDRVVVFRPLDRSAWSGRSSPATVARWLGAPVAPDTLIGLLAGQVPLPRDPAAARVEPDPEPHLAFDQDGFRHRVWVGPDGRPARLVLEGSERLVATFTWGTGGARHPAGAGLAEATGGAPARLDLEAPGREVLVAVRYQRTEAADPPPEAFELTLPSGVRVERVD